jgi:hypothetical protein
MRFSTATVLGLVVATGVHAGKVPPMKVNLIQASCIVLPAAPERRVRARSRSRAGRSS